MLATVREELSRLLQERANLVGRIGALQRLISGLASVYGDEVLDTELLELAERNNNGRQPGFTRACRITLMEASQPLSVREICQQIEQRAPNVLQHHKAPRSSVNTVLNRLVDYGEARVVARENAPRAWSWIADSDRRIEGT